MVDKIGHFIPEVTNIAVFTFRKLRNRANLVKIRLLSSLI
jgi:hypothetical protein